MNEPPDSLEPELADTQSRELSRERRQQIIARMGPLPEFHQRWTWAAIGVAAALAAICLGVFLLR
jgi:hypothetical protein